MCYNELLFDERYALQTQSAVSELVGSDNYLQTHCKLLVSVNGDNQEAAKAKVRSIFLHRVLSERIPVNEDHHFVGMFV